MENFWSFSETFPDINHKFSKLIHGEHLALPGMKSNRNLMEILWKSNGNLTEI